HNSEIVPPRQRAQNAVLQSAREVGHMPPRRLRSFPPRKKSRHRWPRDLRRPWSASMSDVSNEQRDGLLARISDRSARVGVIGLGYVGLPLVLLFEEAGFPVIGFDVDEPKTTALTPRESYIRHLRAERIAKAFTGGGNVIATTDFARLRQCDAI